jgi:hypothetical protein
MIIDGAKCSLAIVLHFQNIFSSADDHTSSTLHSNSPSYSNSKLMYDSASPAGFCSFCETFSLGNSIYEDDILASFL